MSDQQVSLPFLLIFLVTVGLATRYFFFSGPAPAAPGAGGRDAGAARRREAAAERVLQMFPQAERRAVLWDLARNGGSVQVTCERILAGRLETPPITFQPPTPPGSTAAPASTQAQAKQPAKPQQPDLITRYNLQNKLDGAGAGAGTGAEDGEPGKKEGWSASKDERQALLRKRRDDMILAARRKMEAKMAAEKEAAAGAGTETES